jgi:hypothetical protein
MKLISLLLFLEVIRIILLVIILWAVLWTLQVFRVWWIDWTISDHTIVILWLLSCAGEWNILIFEINARIYWRWHHHSGLIILILNIIVFLNWIWLISLHALPIQSKIKDKIILTLYFDLWWKWYFNRFN